MQNSINKEITPDQAKVILKNLYTIHDYIAKLKERMEKAELTNNSRIYHKTTEVYNSMLSLCIELCEVRDRH